MVKLNKIYTRTGDDGTTGLVDGSRSPKHAARIEAIGAVDEANSALGFAICAIDNADDLRRIQNDLFDLGADLATPKGALDGEGFEPGEMVLRIVSGQVEWLERAIDTANESIGASARRPGERSPRGTRDDCAGTSGAGQPGRAALYQPAFRSAVRARPRRKRRREGRCDLGSGGKSLASHGPLR